MVWSIWQQALILLERAGSINNRTILKAIKETELKAETKNIYLPEGIRFDRSGKNIQHHPIIIQIERTKTAKKITPPNPLS